MVSRAEVVAPLVDRQAIARLLDLASGLVLAGFAVVPASELVP